MACRPLFDRVALRSFNAGDQVTASDLGPKVDPAASEARVVRIPVVGPVSARPGDRVSLMLVPLSTVQASPVPASGLVAIQTNVPSEIPDDVVVLRVPSAGPDGLVPLLVAVPASPDGQANLAAIDATLRRMLGHAVGHVIGRPAAPASPARPDGG